MRCPTCEKFVSYGEADPEITDYRIEQSEDSAEVVGTVRVVLVCAEDETELKESELDFEMPIGHTCDDSTLKMCNGCDGSGEVTDDCETCRGTGYVYPGQFSSASDGEPCDNCEGSGKVEVTCEDCDGRGHEPLDYDELFELDGEPSAEFTSRQQTTFLDKKGNVRPIKSSRYYRNFYGASISATVRCTNCKESIDVSTTVEEQASSFSEL